MDCSCTCLKDDTVNLVISSPARGIVLEKYITYKNVTHITWVFGVRQHPVLQNKIPLKI